MVAYLSSLVRSGVVSFIAIASLAAAPSLAAPLGPILNPPSAENSKLLPVAMGEGRDHGPGYRVWPRAGRGNWNGGRHWNGGGRHWNGNGNWNRGWRGGHGAVAWG